MKMGENLCIEIALHFGHIRKVLSLTERLNSICSAQKCQTNKPVDSANCLRLSVFVEQSCSGFE